MKNIHFVGIGGVGMSGIADILVTLGYKVSGSDLNISNGTKRLEEKGVKVIKGHKSSNIDESIDTVVTSTAINRENPEVKRAQELNIPIIKRAEMLAQLMKRQKAICIAGAHGKTTTTSMIASVLEINNFDPSIVVGGELNVINSNAKLGKGDYLVAEADESDGSFLNLFPWSNIITNIEDDHLDFYGTLENMIDSFTKYIALGSPDGYTILCADDPLVSQMAINAPGKVVTYGLNEKANITARNINFQGTITRCDVYYNEELLGNLELSIPGKHNLSNALATIAICRELNLSFSQISTGLKQFTGVKRRFQLIGKVNDILVYDDYAHHPTEVKACLQAARSMHEGRIIAVFQPHRYSRTRLLAKEFAQSYGDADKLILSDIYAASEEPLVGISSNLIMENLPKGSEAIYIEKNEDIVEHLRYIAKPGDLIITMGAGDIWKVGKDIISKLNNKQQGVS
ncbi:UDP-N-acetylmuramate--L-alanine ligase [Desulfonispora thiosulfatigenes DSM 11270]|uniref:UDP-N-acetylmuramate--L-alanine ligase n=1 Tax=Desulfonispora thiosulfatigenes DSM 11270 TaxID=656914 RepID=A0A1W1VSW8_DESTI|nr:UDP-N-acetylmuramate--L-alanine ligase [Desulfonispora thiosulfatigenes DSM 11270]